MSEGFFYEQRDALTRGCATEVLRFVFAHFGPIQSVVDVGCGVGTWLSVSESLGASRVLGLEGPWLSDQPRLATARENITLNDLSKGVAIPGSFDLGISLEVAEHLPAVAGRTLVRSLARQCRVVLFSAAIPGQGGVGHINEQRPTYWQTAFRQEGFEALDIVRPRIWYRDDFPWWYRQNMVVYVGSETARSYFRTLSDGPEFVSPPLTDGLINRPAPAPSRTTLFSRIKTRVSARLETSRNR